MKSFLVPSGDKEEGAALVPPQEDGEAPRKVVVDGGKAADPAVERLSPSSPSTTKPWWKTSLLSPTKGAVGLVIGGLVLLALLAGAKWIDLDAVSTPYAPPSQTHTCMRAIIHQFRSIVPYLSRINHARSEPS